MTAAQEVVILRLVDAQAQTLRKPLSEARQTAKRPRELAITSADEELAGFTRALGHPIRVAIVRYLLEQGESVCTDLSEVVPLAHSTTMQHIKVLKEAGLLSAGRCGRNVLYCVNPEALRQLRALVGRL